MSDTSLDLVSLSLLVLVVVISCSVATLLSWCWVRSMSPRAYQYCYPCAQQLGVLSGLQVVLTDRVQARPWVGCGGQQVGNYGDSGTFQRLGMRTPRPGMGMEVGNLETRPLSTVPCEEGEERGSVVKDNVQIIRYVNQQIISPASAEVLARRDSVRSLALGCRMSRRALVFPTQSQHSLQSLARSQQNKGYKPQATGQKILEKSTSINSPSNTLVGAETDHKIGKLERTMQDTRQRQVRRSVSARKEKSRYMVLRRQEDAGFTSQSEDERGVGGSRYFRRHHTGFVDGKADQLGGYSNHGFVDSEESPNPSHPNQDQGHQQHQSPSTVSPRPGYENLPTIQFPHSADDLPPGAVSQLI